MRRDRTIAVNTQLVSVKYNWGHSTAFVGNTRKDILMGIPGLGGIRDTGEQIGVGLRQGERQHHDLCLGAVTLIGRGSLTAQGSGQK